MHHVLTAKQHKKYIHIHTYLFGVRVGTYMDIILLICQMSIHMMHSTHHTSRWESIEKKEKNNCHFRIKYCNRIMQNALKRSPQGETLETKEKSPRKCTLILDKYQSEKDKKNLLMLYTKNNRVFSYSLNLSTHTQFNFHTSISHTFWDKPSPIRAQCLEYSSLHENGVFLSHGDRRLI